MTPTDFIARWKHATGSELANAQLFVLELCELLELPRPEPASEDVRDNAYVFERRIREKLGDGSEAERRVDCYRRGAFVLESKKIKAGPATKGFDEALRLARAQAEGYARALPAAEGRPPFLVVVDVGHVIELYSEFSRSGATYTPYPDPRSYRLKLEDLEREDIRERLRRVWLDPDALDPARASAAATREVASRLAVVARSLEAAGHAPEAVAGFLTRCLFTFFAEDVGLLPTRAFQELLASLSKAPQQFVPLVGELWQAMEAGRFSVAIRAEVKRFNGKLFKHPEVLPLSREQIDLLIDCAARDWSHVEPAIIGTLLERALDPRERHKLGAHYTPRAYVERLVLPTVIEPLRADWALAQATAFTLLKDGKPKDAEAELRRFHHGLCDVRVLDPACGSGNFLYVTLEHLKRLEGEVLNQLAELSGGQDRLETQGLTVDPHQLLGIELNPRAAALAEVVLWIGYLQWHFRTRGGTAEPPLPVLKDYGNIECRDAVLAYDRIEHVTDEHGIPLTRWDGRTMKPHPVTGEPVPDEAARIVVERYVNPRESAPWPEADFIVGNPPYIGNKRMRTLLGDGYTEALRGAWTNVSDGVDFVMYWWERCAEQTRKGLCRAFGLITTNSLRQVTNRTVTEPHLSSSEGLSLRFVVADHPWIDSGDGADVRVALTVAACSTSPGRLLDVLSETVASDGEFLVQFRERVGLIHPDLSIGANLADAVQLTANEGLSSRGVIPHGEGLVITEQEARSLGLGRVPGLDQHLPHYRNNKDFTQRPRNVRVIDLFGLSIDEVRERFPEVYQWVVERVKPERDANRDRAFRENWWLFGRSRGDMRRAIASLNRFIATGQTSKHRVFGFMDENVLPDDKLIAIATNDAAALGVLSSRAHVLWALASGSHLGVGNDPVYNKSTCFDCYPFPATSGEQAEHIGKLAEAIDTHRKRQQAAHEDVTLTGLYNVLEKLRSGEALTAKERVIHEHGLVSVLASLHDELDAAVLDAYGWSDLAPALVGKPGGTLPLDDPDEAQAAAQAELLTRLVALNAERAAEEARGLVRWLRPEFQNPAQAAAARPPEQVEAVLEDGDVQSPATGKAKAGEKKQPWPAELPAQVRAVADVLAAARGPLSVEQIAAGFSGRGPWKTRLPTLLDTLSALGQARQTEAGYLASR